MADDRQIIHFGTENGFNDLQPCPDGYTRFVLVSDTHTRTFPVPPGDILLHAGDLTERGEPKELRKTTDWLCSLPHKHKIIIAGNHDYCLDRKSLAKQKLLWQHDEARATVDSDECKDAGLVYLQDESISISKKEGGKSWRIWGSPWSAAFCSMAFNIPRGEASQTLYASIPNDTEILITHGPPKGIFDKVTRGGAHVGCDALLARTKEIKPRMHVWGHIHEDRGVKVDKKTGTVYVNAANEDDSTRPRSWGMNGHQPIVIDLKDTRSPTAGHL